MHQERDAVLVAISLPNMSPLIRLEGLQTEGRNQESNHIDQVSTLRLCQIINSEDASVAAAVQKCLPIIAQAIDAVEPKARRGGRIVYVGAGTSGRYAHPTELGDSN